jgi:type I restriction enzyme, S subunit
MTTTNYKYIKIVEFKNLDCWSVKLLNQTKGNTSNLDHVAIGKVMSKNRQSLSIQNTDTYNRVTIKLYNKGLKIRDTVLGSKIGVKKQTVISQGQFIMSKIDARNGAFGVVTAELEGAITTADFLSYNVNEDVINADYLRLLTTTKQFTDLCESTSTGTTGRKRISERLFLQTQIPLPVTLGEQQSLVQAYQSKIIQAESCKHLAKDLEARIESYLIDELGIEIVEKKKQDNGYKFLQFVEFRNLREWGILASNYINFKSNRFATYILKDICNIGSGGTPSRTNPKYYTGYIPWVTTGELREKLILDTKEMITVDALNNSSAKIYPKNSLVLAMYGATVGRIAKLGVEASTNQACAVLYNFNTKVNEDFIYEYLIFQKPRLIQLATGSAQPNLNAEKVKNFKVPLPPLETQNKIVGQINLWKNEINRLKIESEELEALAKSEFEEDIFRKTKENII